MTSTSVKIGGTMFTVEYENGRWTLIHQRDVLISSPNQMDILNSLGNRFKAHVSYLLDDAARRQS